MKRHAFWMLVMLALVFATAEGTAQPKGAAVFTVEGDVLYPLQLSVNDLAGFDRMKVAAQDKDGNTHVYEGVRLGHILDSAGVTLGKALRGANLAKYIVVVAADGYNVIFALPEVDPEFTDQTILIACSSDGKPLPENDGPFRMIVPGDKKHARWIRQITTIKIIASKD